MDKLSELPVKNDTVQTSEESELINKLFPQSKEHNASSAGNPITKPPGEVKVEPKSETSYKNSFVNRAGKINWKLIGLTSLLFVALANPWIDSLFCKLPYCGDNVIYLLILKVLIFFIVMITISMTV
jgi:hypothetical protein